MRIPNIVFISFLFFCIPSMAEGKSQIITIDSPATIDDLKKVLNHWEILHEAIQQYAPKSEYAQCNVGGITVDHIVGLSGMTPEAVKTYYPELVDISSGNTLKVIWTRDPCYLNDSVRDVGWIYTTEENKYQVVFYIKVI